MCVCWGMEGGGKRRSKRTEDAEGLEAGRRGGGWGGGAGRKGGNVEEWRERRAK